MPIKTGIYGGSFNPVHFGHVRLARHIRRAAALDEVWLMLSPQNPFKVSQSLLPDQQRLRLLQLALRREKGLVASDYELSLPKPSYTWNTLRKLSADFPERAFTLIIGADNWAAFQQWHRADDILSNYPIVVYPRTGSPVDSSSMPQGVTLVDMPLINISSTDIRQRIAQGRSISRLVPKAVERAIAEKRLYR